MAMATASAPYQLGLLIDVHPDKFAGELAVDLSRII